MSTTERFVLLLDGYSNNKLNVQEENELFVLIQSGKFQHWLEWHIQESLEEESLPGEGINPEKAKMILTQIMKERSEIQITRFNWRKLAVAASVIGLLLVAGYFVYKSQIPNSKSQITDQSDVQSPKSNKATLQLADGRIIVLDSVADGNFVPDGNMTITKQGDQIVYQSPVSSPQSAVKYNTLTNPRGSKIINLTLSDGTKVWLNSGSSLKYPTAFVGNERRVEITGEGYFEVSTKYEVRSTVKQPFIVDKGDMRVEVLGTHFNVNAFDEESDIKVTLLEGRVKVSQLATRSSQLLIPGQQARLDASGKWQVASGVDMDEVLAWKNNVFQYEDADIKNIMREVSRWYGVEVVYTGEITRKFYIDSVSRSVPISYLLEWLERAGKVHFKIDKENNRIIVSP